jgi:DNA-binding HxlR family transcriptional regulator
MTNKLSAQERWILKNAPPGDWDVKQLREMLPAEDSRSRPVQSASLSRSVSRLVQRGLVERWVRGRWSDQLIYLYRTCGRNG